MPKSLKHLKGRVKGTFRGLFGKSPAPSTHAGFDEPLPSASASRGASPLPHVPDPPSSARQESTSSPDATVPRSGVESLQQILNTASGLLGPLQPVINDLTEFFEAYKDAAAADSDFAALHRELRLLLETLNTSFPSDVPPVISECVGDLCRSINKELDKISGREKGMARRRLWEADKDLAKARVCRDQIRGHVDTATLKIVGGHGKMLAEQGKVLDEHRKLFDEQAKTAEEREKHLRGQSKLAEDQARLAKDKATEDQMEKLKPSLSACYKSFEAANLRRECTPNTREDVLLHLDEWRRDLTQGNIFWMNGMAGTGKTTIANTLCAKLKSAERLGASFFCTRTLPECRSVKLILPTIAYQLAGFSPAFRDALSQALKSDSDLPTKDLPTQLEGLILTPLRNATEPLPVDAVIVIDALDECEDRTAVEEILGVFMAEASTLPIKVFVSSRPEEEIRRQIRGTTSRVVLHELDKKTVQADIGLYLREELKGTSVSDDQLAELVERAGVLFIYASTVARFINAKRSPSGQQERLKIVLRTSSTSPSRKDEIIDALYSAVLDSAFNKPGLEDFERDRMRELLHTVVCAQEPLTADALAGLLNMADSDLVLDALEPLWSVVHVSGSGGASLVTTLHASFPDYMFDPTRSTKYSCNATAHHGRLAELCLARIENNERKFNICELESSYVPDEQVLGLEDRINNAIPLDLFYACQYWAVHLELGEWSRDRVKLLDNFLSKQLLIWMEVLNLKKRMNTGAISLERARKWCTNGGDSETAGELIHDAWRFVTTFASNPISRSTPHIYVSMLAFWPSSSKLITGCYVKQAARLAEVTGSGMTRRQLALLGVFAVGGVVTSVAFSPDGARIICGCWDGTISVWDVQRGKVVLGPLRGHTWVVNSVAFSPDGQRIASGSWDNSIRLWDARSGKELRTLEGHTDWVSSVAFSPDSARIVSGSEDKTIRVWDAQRGEMVLGPFEGHTSHVLSVSFSPNGIRIVSGSDDKTILVWDSQSGQVALGPLEGHTDRVNSVAFSPDGNQIVSGSNDQTIRVWDATSGKPIPEPLEGHTGPVDAVAFSPDGTHIVSGSSDRSIRVWDARSGKVVLGPLEGHTDGVFSVAFSPDGMRIVSGSKDKTIRVWDAQSREVASEPLEGHADVVTSVAFAPDGMRIVSGSFDKAVRVWNAQTGKTVLGPFEGHTQLVTAVAFSPDGRLIVSGSYGNTIRLWDARNGEMVPGSPMGDSLRVSSVAFSPDSTRIVFGSDQIHVWDLQCGKMLLGPLKGHEGGVFSVVFSPDGMQIVSGGGDKTLLVWDAHNGKKMLGPFRGHTSLVNSVAFSPNGRSIVSGSHDTTLRVWDTQSGNTVLGPLEGHTSSVQSVAFSPNETYIASGSFDNTIRVWAAQTGELVLGPLNGHTAPIRSVSFSPDSTQIVSGSNDKVIRVWHLPSRLLSADSSSPDSPSPFRQVADSPISQPNLPYPASHNMPLQWLLDEEGWVVDERQNLWLWVPPDLRTSLFLPHNTLLISSQGSVHLNFDGAAIGESWADSYSPA